MLVHAHLYLYKYGSSILVTVMVILTGYRRLECSRGLIVEERVFYEMRYL